MSDYQASSLYLACLSSSPKKRSTRQLKAVQDELSKLAADLSPTTLIHREGARDVPFAWDALTGELVYQHVQLVYFYSDSNSGEELYLSHKGSKREKLDLESFTWKAFPDLKLLILEGSYTLDLAEQLLFSDAPAVLMLPQKQGTAHFRNILFSQLLKGERLSFALNASCNELGIQMPLYTIPSDPYDYWAWKEESADKDLQAGCLINLSGKEGIINWSWTPYAYHEAYEEPVEEQEPAPEPEPVYFEEPVEEEEPRFWFEEESEFSTWHSGQLVSSYLEGREREFRHIAAKTGDIHPSPGEGSQRQEYEQQSFAYSGSGETHTGYEVVPVKSMEEGDSFEEANEGHQQHVYSNEGRSQEDREPEVGSTNSWLSWPVLTWIGLTCALVTLSSIAYVMPGRQTPKLSDFKFLSHYSSSEEYKVLLLPFDPVSSEEGGSSWAEETVRDWVNTLPESQEMGIRVIYASGASLPANTEEAKRIGEIYNANLVIWGDYGSFSRDTSIQQLKYVSPNSIYSKTSNAEPGPGAAAFNDVYDLQEGFLTVGIEDINYWILATAYLKKGDYRSAFSNLQQVQEIKGRGTAVVHQMIAKCYFGLEYFSDCIQAYTTAIEHDPENANAYYQRAIVYQMTSKHEKAIEDYQMTLKVNPNHLEAKARLEELKELLENVEVQVPDLEQTNNTSFSLLEGAEAYSKNEESK